MCHLDATTFMSRCPTKPWHIPYILLPVGEGHARYSGLCGSCSERILPGVVSGYSLILLYSYMKVVFVVRFALDHNYVLHDSYFVNVYVLLVVKCDDGWTFLHVH